MCAADHLYSDPEPGSWALTLRLVSAMSTWDKEVKCCQDISQGRDNNLDHVRAQLLDPDLHHHLGLGLVPVVGDLTTDE